MARLKSNSSQIAFEEIKERINRYDILPGETVSDISLSKEFEMSRTPIREAIQSLIQYNLVEKQRTKFVVKAISIKDIKEILEAREAIEIQAIRSILINKKITEENIEELNNIQNLLEKSIKEKNFNANFHYDSKFHNTIIGFTSNSRLMEIMKSLSIQGERLRWISLLTPQSYDKTVNEHKQIILALTNQDLDLSMASIHNHLETAKLNYNTIVSNASWLDVILSFKQMFKA